MPKLNGYFVEAVKIALSSDDETAKRAIDLLDDATNKHHFEYFYYIATRAQVLEFFDKIVQSN